MAQQETHQDVPEPDNVEKRDKSRKKITLRLIVQIFFFAIIAVIAVNHALEKQRMAISF